MAVGFLILGAFWKELVCPLELYIWFWVKKGSPQLGKIDGWLWYPGAFRYRTTKKKHKQPRIKKINSRNKIQHKTAEPPKKITAKKTSNRKRQTPSKTYLKIPPIKTIDKTDAKYHLKPPKIPPILKLNEEAAQRPAILKDFAMWSRRFTCWETHGAASAGSSPAVKFWEVKV